MTIFIYINLCSSDLSFSTSFRFFIVLYQFKWRICRELLNTSKHHEIQYNPKIFKIIEIQPVGHVRPVKKVTFAETDPTMENSTVDGNTRAPVVWFSKSNG